jgi:hypothetical protein
MPKTSREAGRQTSPPASADRLEARAVYALDLVHIEPDLTAPGVDTGDAGLQTELTNDSYYFLTRVLTPEQRQTLLDRGIRRLIAGCRTTGKGWRSALQLGIERLLRDSVAFQMSLPGDAGCGGRVDQEQISVLCGWAIDNLQANLLLDKLYQLDYYEGIRLWSSVAIVSGEGPENGAEQVRREDEWMRLSTELFARLSPEPDQCLSDLTTLETCLRKAAIVRLTPVVRQLLQVAPPPTLEEKRAVSSRLNRVLAELGLAIKDPTTGRPCSVAVAPDRGASGYFRLQAKKMDATNRPATEEARGNFQRQSAITTKLPPLELMEAPRQERLARPR